MQRDYTGLYICGCVCVFVSKICAVKANIGFTNFSFYAYVLTQLRETAPQIVKRAGVTAQVPS